MNKNIFNFYAICFVAVSSCLVAQVKPVAGKGKVLTSPQMRLLNIVFEENPIAVVRTKITCAKAAKTIKEIDEIKESGDKTKKSIMTDKQERAFIEKHLKLSVDPVKQFFDVIKNHKSHVLPVIAESLNISEKDVKKSWLLRCLNTTEDVTTFFDREIKSIDDLKSACAELIVVFSDVNASLSERAKKLCKEVIKQMKESKKQDDKK